MYRYFDNRDELVSAIDDGKELTPAVPVRRGVSFWLGWGLAAAIGAVAGWRGGIVDRLTMGVADVLLSLPRLILLLVCAALWAPGMGTPRSYSGPQKSHPSGV